MEFFTNQAQIKLVPFLYFARSQPRHKFGLIGVTKADQS
jgi:hypothetical protein